jgi:radical SAM protein (TIGR01212 family)
MPDIKSSFPWGHSRRFNAYPEYMKKIFGGRVQKLTIDAGFSCPNRDGSKSTGGCTFCVNDAFNPSYCNPQKSVIQQIREGIEFHEKRYRRAEAFLAYFQAYSNTHAPLEKLIPLYEEALSVEGIAGLVIGTRPDCVNDEKLDYFKKLAEKQHIVIEYGIESVYDKTLMRVNRCHTFQESVDAIKKTADRGIHTGAHMIFGLPGETREEMMQSAQILSALPIHSIKFHQLQIFKGSRLEADYSKNPDDFLLFGEEEYLGFITEYVSQFNPRIIIERIAGETPPRFSVVRPWGPRYDQILVKFERKLEEKDSWQGKYYSA